MKSHFPEYEPENGGTTPLTKSSNHRDTFLENLKQETVGAIPVVPEGGWTPIVPSEDHRNDGLLKRASVFFKAVTQQDKAEEDDDDDVFHEHVLGGLAKSNRDDNDEKDDDNPRSIESVLKFGVNTFTLNFCHLLFLVAFFVPAYALRSVDLNIFLDMDDPEVRFECIATCCAIPPIWIFMIWGVSQIIPTDDDDDDRSRKNTSRKIRWPSRSLTLLLGCVTIELLDAVTREVVRKDFQDMTIFLINRALAFTMVALCNSLLDDCVHLVQRYADRAEAIVTSSPKNKKWKGFMKGLSRFQIHDIDKAYSIPGGSRSPARVLAEVIGVYCTLGKVMVFSLLFLFMVGVDLYSSLVTFGLSALFLSVINSLHINDALSNLLPLAISNTLHVGELISICRSNGMSGMIWGCVEGITWSHVVIRGFDRKQIFIPHKEMTHLAISNWSRRPSWWLQLSLLVKPTHGGGVGKAGSLARFVDKWMKNHPEIDQTLEIEADMKLTPDGGITLEFTCYPKTGESRNKIRGDMTVMIIEAAQRLDLCIVNTYHGLPERWNVSGSATTATAMKPETAERAATGGEDSVGTASAEEKSNDDGSCPKDDHDRDAALLADLMAYDTLREKAGYCVKKEDSKPKVD